MKINHVYHDPIYKPLTLNCVQIGEDLQVWFQSDLDKVYAILDSQNNPMSFLCQGLQEDPLDRSTSATDKIDKYDH